MTRGLIAWALMLTGWIAILCDIVHLKIAGLFLAGVILLAAAWWLLGVWARIAAWFRSLADRWVATIPEDHPDSLGSLDILELAHLQDQDHGTDIQR